jgi:hypothetical protein
MNHTLKENERELVKLVNFFRKRAEKLIKEGKLGDEHKQVITACERLIDQIQKHAATREDIYEQREKLQNIVKDNAECPQCNKGTHLKLIGVGKHEQGWKSNRYKCRRCNIEFLWRTPNNPWDMIPFMESSIQELEQKVQNKNTGEDMQQQSMAMIEQMKKNLEKLKPVIEGFDKNFQDLQAKELEMIKMIHEFKNYLLIEKIKMDSWNPTQGQS